MQLMRMLFLAALGFPLAAQTYYPRHNFTFGLGAGQPRGDLTRFFENSFGLNFGYGYRFHRHFQVDAGMETVFGAAGVRDFLPSQVFGDLRIRDYQFLAPVGGRAILPLGSERVLFSGGGGAAYLRYTERLRQPSDYFSIDCPVCASRHGIGSYALANLKVALDRYRRFWVGVTGRVYRGHTNGDPLGAQPGIRTRDHWVNVYGEFGVSF